MSVETNQNYTPLPLKDPKLPEEVDYIILYGLRDRIINGVLDKGMELKDGDLSSYHLGEEGFSVRVICHKKLKMILRNKTEIDGRYNYIGYREDTDSWNFLSVDESNPQNARLLWDSGQINEHELDIDQICKINLALGRFSQKFSKVK